jgi:pyruvate dehydrogenase E1 component alpha subunit
MEMLTYRYRGHSMSDPAKYRSKEEVQKVRQERDPIERLRGIMAERNVMDEAKLKEIDKDVKAIVSEAADFAQTSPEPDVSELYTDVYVSA